MTYDVVENDIALLNVYFGESTAMGKYESYWKGFGYSSQSMSEA